MVKVDRSYPAPESLAIEAKKQNGKYNKIDVVRRLKKDFHDKCYICGLKGLQDPVVEHLLPYMNGKYPERKFDWDNLFWSCGHCNGVKNNSKYDEGIIDCCRQNPEELLMFSLSWGEETANEMSGDDVQVSPVDASNQEAARTAILIYETFNLKNHGIREAACENRMNSLREAMNVLYRELDCYKKNRSSGIQRRKLRALLKRESEFAAFKRSYVRAKYKEDEVLQSYVR